MNSYDPYPSQADVHELAHAHARLAAYGVMAGTQGYDIDTLAAASYGEGWSYRIDRVAGRLGYQAAVQAPQGAACRLISSGVGWDPAVALSFALCSALQAQATRRRTLAEPAPTAPGTG